MYFYLWNAILYKHSRDLRSDHFAYTNKSCFLGIEILGVCSVSSSIVFSPAFGLHRRVTESMEGVA